jgi:lipopolysaccharide/colanic/teichoic acid biosynthesis glycosyltransferase
VSTAGAAALNAPRTTGVGPARRTLDVAVSLLLLLVTSPLFIVVAVLIAATSSGPVFFRQTRLGEGERRFSMYKFRTMRSTSGGSEFTAPGDPRVTRLGATLRTVHLDELPQLLNVLRGDMTLVGPRPETPALAAGYPAECRSVLRFRPGITGPCQVWMNKLEVPAGEEPEDYYLRVLVPRRVALDMRYLEAPTLRQTLAVLGATVAVLLRLRSAGPRP